MSLPLLNVGLMWVFPSLQSGSTGYQTLILPFPCSKCFGSILDGKQRALRSAGSTLERLHEALASLISTLIPFTVSFRCLCLWRWGRPLKYLGSPHVLKENPHLGCPSLLIPLGNPVGLDLPTTTEGAHSFLELPGIVRLGLLLFRGLWRLLWCFAHAPQAPRLVLSGAKSWFLF